MSFDDVLLQIKENIPSLIFVSLHSQHIEDDGAERLSTLIQTNTTLKSIDLGDNDIGDVGAKALSNALLVNETIKSLDLGGNKISDAGLKDLSEALEKNTTLKALSLRHNNFSHIGLEHFSKMLTINNTLRSIDLGGNKISYLNSHPAFANALQSNITLKFLNLSNTQFGEYGKSFARLCDAIKANSTIKSIDLSASNLNSYDLNELRSALEINTSIKSINLNFNIHTDQGRSLGLLLKNNSPLQSIYLFGSNNRLTPKGIKHINDALSENYTLLHLHGIKYFKSTTKDLLERNQEIHSHSVKHFELYIKGTLDPNELAKSYSKLTNLILKLSTDRDQNFHAKHYLIEAHRLLAALLHISEGHEGEAEAMTNLLSSFTHPQLQKLSEQLQNQLLGTSIKNIQSHSIKHFDAFTSRLGDGLDREALVSSHEEITHIIQKIKNPLSETHYLTEIHRLLTSLTHMAAFGPGDIDALSHLLPPFRDQPLQRVADLAISFILSISMDEKIKPSIDMSSQQKQAHYQLILYGFLKNSLDRYDEIQPFIYNALSNLLCDKNGATFAAVSSLRETTALLSYADCLTIAEKALESCNIKILDKYKKNSKTNLEIDEKKLLEKLLTHKNYVDGVIQYLFLSPTFISLVKENYLGKKSLVLIEHCLLDAKESILLLPENVPKTTAKQAIGAGELPTTHQITQEIKEIVNSAKKMLGDRLGFIIEDGDPTEESELSLSPHYPVDLRSETKLFRREFYAFSKNDETVIRSIKQVSSNLLLRRAKQNDTSLTSVYFYINPSDYWIKHLAEVLRQKSSLTDLNLGGCDIGDNGIEYLSKALAENTTLRTLNLEGTLISDVSLEALSQTLLTNVTLKQIILLANEQIGDTGTKALGKALKINSTLESMIFRGYRSEPPMAATLLMKYLAQALVSNFTLLHFDYMSLIIIHRPATDEIIQIQECLARNKRIESLTQEFSRFFLPYYGVTLSQEKLVSYSKLITGLIAPLEEVGPLPETHYLAEVQRLLSAFICIISSKAEEDQQAIILLEERPFTHSKLQKIADLALEKLSQKKITTASRYSMWQEPIEDKSSVENYVSGAQHKL